MEPLRSALPDVELARASSPVAQGRELVACYGHYLGTFAADWFGIPATQQTSCALPRRTSWWT